MPLGLAIWAAAAVMASAGRDDVATETARSTAAHESPAATRAPDRNVQLLELWIDGETQGVTARVMSSGGRLFVAAEDLRTAGLSPAEADDRFVDLTSVGLSQAIVEPGNQRLLTQHATGRRKVIDLAPPSTLLSAPSARGMSVRYDVFAAHDSGVSRSSWGAAFGATAFGAFGLLDATGFTRHDAGRTRSVRLDTSLEIHTAANLRRVTLGDSQTASLWWSRSVRFAGVQIARDFDLQPGFNPLPSAAFAGSTAVPSDIEVYVNAMRVYSGRLGRGAFELRNIPAMTGRGEAVVSVTDALGRAVTTTIPLYTDGRMLAGGVTDYSVELGAFRRAYGLRSFEYGPPFAAATVRRGLGRGFTLEGSGEASARVAKLGAGLVAPLGPFGSLAASAALSDGEGRAGSLYGVSVQTDFDRWRAFGAALVSSGDFADLAAADGGFRPPDRSYRLGAMIDLTRRSNFSASAVWRQSRDGDVRLATVAYAFTPGGGWSMGASGISDHSGRRWAMALYVRVPLGRAHGFSSALESDGDRTSTRVRLDRRRDPDGGVSYALQADSAARAVSAEATWIGRSAEIRGAVASVAGRPAAQAGIAGEVVLIGGMLSPLRQGGGATALVETGKPGLKIYRENRLSAITDRHGRALLTGLPGLAMNTISIDPNDLSLNETAQVTQVRVVPPPRGTVPIRLLVRRTSPAELRLRLSDGTPPPPGSRLSLSDGRTFVVGREGAVFIDDLSGDLFAEIEGMTPPCHIDLRRTPDLGADTIPVIEAVCRVVSPWSFAGSR